MKILLINVSASSGSVGKIVTSLYKGIKASGNECKIAYGRDDIGEIAIEDAYRIETNWGTRIHAIKSRFFGRSGFYSKKSTKKFVNWIDDYKPDIIHLHGAYGYYVNMRILFDYIAEKNIALVSTLHSCWDFTGHCCYFDYPKCEKWRTDCSGCNRIHDYPESWFFDSTQRNLSEKIRLYKGISNLLIVTPSDWLKSLCNESKLKGIPVRTIHNGIDLEVFKIYEGNRSSYDIPQILCVANVWTKRKGLDDIIELANYAKERVRIVVVGLGEKEIKRLPLGIVGISRTKSIRELVDLYNNSTILFNPTYEDNYPTVNIEAIACGLPVATYDTGGCKETIQESRYGQIIEKQNYEQVIKYAYSVYTGEIKYDFNDMQYYGREKMISEYIEQYTKMIEEQK